MNENHARGKMDDLKGKVKGAAGDLTGNHEAQAKGAVDRVKGAVKSAVGDLKDKASAAKNEVAHKVNQLKK